MVAIFVFNYRPNNVKVGAKLLIRFKTLLGQIYHMFSARIKTCRRRRIPDAALRPHGSQNEAWLRAWLGKGYDRSSYRGTVSGGDRGLVEVRAAYSVVCALKPHRRRVPPDTAPKCLLYLPARRTITRR